MFQYQALGRLTVADNGDELSVGGPRQRRLVAMLLVHRGSIVSAGQLAEAVFAGEPTPGAQTTLRSYVARLRRVIDRDAPDSTVVTRAPGYMLVVPADAFDVSRFEQLLARAGRSWRRMTPSQRLARCARHWTFGGATPTRSSRMRNGRARRHSAYGSCASSHAGQNRQVAFQQTKADSDYKDVHTLLVENTDLTRVVHKLTEDVHESLLGDATTPTSTPTSEPGARGRGAR